MSMREEIKKYDEYIYWPDVDGYVSPVHRTGTNGKRRKMGYTITAPGTFGMSKEEYQPWGTFGLSKDDYQRTGTFGLKQDEL